MPAQYEKIRDALIRRGMSVREAKRRAAMIYNARRRTHPNMPKLSNRHKSRRVIHRKHRARRR